MNNDPKVVARLLRVIAATETAKRDNHDVIFNAAADLLERKVDDGESPAFTPDEVVNLDNYQRAGQMHPFTCPNRDRVTHRDMAGDLGALIPTVRGWICPFCDYTQNWAHDFMKRRR